MQASLASNYRAQMIYQMSQAGHFFVIYIVIISYCIIAKMCSRNLIFGSRLTQRRYCLQQRTLTIGGNIIVRLTSCLTGLDLTKEVKLMLIKHKQS